MVEKRHEIDSPCSRGSLGGDRRYQVGERARLSVICEVRDGEEVVEDPCGRRRAIVEQKLAYTGLGGASDMPLCARQKKEHTAPKTKLYVVIMAALGSLTLAEKFAVAALTFLS